jgi:hypothetical protein
MSTPHAYIHAVAATTPLVVGAGLALGGPSLAARVALVAVVVVLNLLLTSGLSSRALRAASQGAAGGGSGLVVKQVAALPVAVGLAAVLGPEALALGLGAIVLGTVVHALSALLRAADASVVAGAARLAALSPGSLAHVGAASLQES